MRESQWLHSLDPVTMIEELRYGGESRQTQARQWRQLVHAIEPCFGRDGDTDEGWEDDCEMLADDQIVTVWTQDEKAALVRDVMGNPWRPIEETLTQRHWLTPGVIAMAQACYLDRLPVTCELCQGTGSVSRSPNTPGKGFMSRRFISKICSDCKGSRTLVSSRLNPVGLAILSDALEEAGCTSEMVLAHLRGQQGDLHVQGCWAVEWCLAEKFS